MKNANLGEVGPPMCYNCKHQSAADPLKCDAFPAGIPKRILYSQFDHRKPFDGDRGILFDPFDSSIPVPPIDDEPAAGDATI